MTSAAVPLESRDRRPFAAAALLVAAMLAYGGTHWDMVITWARSDTFGHCFLIPVIAGFLVWLKRAELRAAEWTTSYRALVVLAVLALFWLVGDLAALEVVTHFAVVAMLPVLVWAVFGDRVGRILLFPACYLLLAVPFGEWAIEPLMEFTADFAVGAVQLFGLPIYREGYFFSLPAGDFEVAKACSGIRYVVAGLSLALFYGYLTMRGTLRLAVFVAAAVVVAILANGVRATAIVLIANASDLRLAAGVDHLIYGWLFFGAVAFLIISLARFFEPKVAPPERPAASGEPQRTGRPFAVAAVGLAVLLVGPALHAIASGGVATTPAAPAALDLPSELGQWRAAGETSWTPRFISAAASRTQAYTDGSRAFAVATARYANAWRGSELVNSENKLFVGQEWREVAHGTRTVAVDGRTLAVNTIEVTNGATVRLIWYWYAVGERDLAAPWLAKLAELWRGLTVRDAASAIVAVATDSSSRDTADALLAEILDAHRARIVAAALAADGAGSARRDGS